MGQISAALVFCPAVALLNTEKSGGFWRDLKGGNFMGTTEKKSFKALRLKEITFSDFKALSFKRTNPQNAHVTKRNRNHYTAQLAQNKAAYLCQKLNSPQNENFYLKCAWNLTDAYIDDLLVRAMGKMNPTRYFVSAASREMRSNN